MSFTLDFEEEAAFSRYDLKDSLTPVSTIGNQLIVIFKTLGIFGYNYLFKRERLTICFEHVVVKS